MASFPIRSQSPGVIGAAAAAAAALFLAQFSSASSASSSSSSSSSLTLEGILPDGYERTDSPQRGKNATVITTRLTVLSMDSIDEHSMSYTCDVFFAQQWTDPRLLLPGNLSDEYKILPKEWLQSIWHPDPYFKNAKDIKYHDIVDNNYVWLWRDMSILYMVKLALTLSCPMDFKNYPHDTQTCNIQIESISHRTKDLIFSWDGDNPIDIASHIQFPQLELVDYKLGDCSTVYASGRFSCLEVKFKFVRRLGHFLFNTFAPTILIVVVSWFSFWMKPEDITERVMLGVTTLLTVFSQHVISAQSLPPVSYLKAIDIFTLLCTCFVFLSLIEFLVVTVIIKDRPPKLSAFIRRMDVKRNKNRRRKNSSENNVNSINNCRVQLDDEIDNDEAEKKDFSKDDEAAKTSLAPTFSPHPSEEKRRLSRKEEEETDCIDEEEEDEIAREIRRRKMLDLAIKIDRISRVAAPAAFVALNAVYWAVYWGSDNGGGGE